jgi:hypothetical protein
LPNQQIDDDTTTARLPGLEVEIVHRRSPAADAEQISINLQAVPSFEAFGQFLQTANPFAFWAQAAQMAWFPWLGVAPYGSSLGIIRGAAESIVGKFADNLRTEIAEPRAT